MNSRIELKVLLDTTIRQRQKYSSGLIKESFCKLKYLIYRYEYPRFIGCFNVPAFDSSRPPGYRLEVLNRSEDFSGTPVPLKSFKSIQNLQYRKELVAYLQVEALDT